MGYHRELNDREYAVRIRAGIIAELQRLKLDTDDVVIASQGTSGATLIGLIRAEVRNPCVLIRKPDDKNHHGANPGYWHVKHRASLRGWVFVDDCIDTGTTLSRVHDAMRMLNAAPPCLAVILSGVIGYEPSITPDNFAEQVDLYQREMFERLFAGKPLKDDAPAVQRPIVIGKPEFEKLPPLLQPCYAEIERRAIEAEKLPSLLQSCYTERERRMIDAGMPSPWPTIDKTFIADMEAMFTKLGAKPTPGLMSTIAP